MPTSRSSASRISRWARWWVSSCSCRPCSPSASIARCRSGSGAALGARGALRAQARPSPRSGTAAVLPRHRLRAAGHAGVAVWASFIRYWPYNMSLTTANYVFANFDPGGWEPYVNSLRMAGLAALFGTAIIFVGAYVVEKTKLPRALRGFIQFLAMLPMAVPGLVLGSAMCSSSIRRPIRWAFLRHADPAGGQHRGAFLHRGACDRGDGAEADRRGVRVRLGFAQDPVLDDVPARDLADLLPAVLDIAVYIFVNALTTVSAVIFSTARRRSSPPSPSSTWTRRGRRRGRRHASCIVLTASS